MKNWLEKQFRLSEFNTDIKTELLAGLTTFVTMAYVLATIPNILAGAGYDKHTTLTVMILLIIVTSCASVMRKVISLWLQSWIISFRIVETRNSSGIVGTGSLYVSIIIM